MYRCTKKLEHLGDIAAEAEQYNDAIMQYSTALSLNPASPRDVFVKRSRVYMLKALWGDAIDDAKKVHCHF